MGDISRIMVIYFLLLLIYRSLASLEEIKNIFDSNVCIKGSLSTIAIKEPDTLSVKESESEFYLKNNSVAEEDKYAEKNALSKLNELAQFNEIDYFFKLIKEEGTPHNKLFTISLTLGDEEFIGQGSSLKKAQQNVAVIALENSNYEPPEIKEKEKNFDATTPTVLLNNLCAKLGIAVEYFLINNKLFSASGIVNEKPKKSYLQKLNDSIYSDIHIRKDESQTKGPFKVGVEVGELFFYGTSNTIQSARHQAASNAIDYLIKEIQDGNLVCLQEDSEEECRKAKANLKSPISLVHEAAQLRNLNIEFEIIDESGPSHKKAFVTRCTLGHLSTTGEGKSKKESKKAAAINMLERISELPTVSQEMQVQSVFKNNNKKKKNKKNKILKTNFDVISMHVDNLISSVKDYGLPFQNNEDLQKTKSPKNAKPKHLKKSFQDGILELGNSLKFEVQFMDFTEGKRFYTIMSLHINPEHMCLGEGSSSKLARNKAAEGGLNLLQDIDFGSHFKNTKLTLVESEIKQKITILLNEEISKEKTKSTT
ncbi:double-stranded RNA-binding protein Staufen homolog [Anoplophora glabripennis]|uniref:double-stranded RNA-binding protein Staufen homolog n=1 Tax=Anoplophora glabripennis TaxID=217634 RepID=UPI0008753F3D|nr:double-stranded RNA-binding protein Staufen homolog [Anoplophora glabripennis]